MASALTSTGYNSELPPDKTEVPAWQSAALVATEEFLNLLARAVRQFHTYPPDSPLCVDAIAACHKALVSREGSDQLVFRVTPRELLVDDVSLGNGTIIERELARRLHRAHVAALVVDRVASLRDMSRFCGDLIRCHDCGEPKRTLSELLVEHGVDKIAVRMAYRPEVLDVGSPRQPLCSLVERERSRRDALFVKGGPVNHLYPPDKGWVRLDPAATFNTISLVDLAILVEDPIEIATMLLRLTGDQPVGPETREEALTQTFSSVATLFAALDPRLARLMFARLAQAVLGLEPDRRKDLLRRTILPGLLDGGVDGTVMKDFPDVDLAESLCLLLDLETAAPEILSTALDRLDLSDERRQAVIPLLETRFNRRPAESPPDGRGSGTGIDRYARKLIRVGPTKGKSFAEFAPFDLSMDAQAMAAIAGVRDGIVKTDSLATQLQCLWNLVRLEPNPTPVEMFLRRASALLAELEHASRWQELVSWVRHYRDLADRLREPRPDIAEAISAALDAFCTRDRAFRLLELNEAGVSGRAAAGALVEAYGPSIAPAFVAVLEDPSVQSKAHAVVQLMCEHAKLLAPLLAPRVGHCEPSATRALIRVLGFAGPGYEAIVAGQLACREEQTIREALRSLARMGTANAAALVAVQVREGIDWVRGAAEEALWHFPPAQVATQLRELLGRRDFVIHHPQVAMRLLDRAAQAGADGLKQTAAALVPLRFRFWNPAVVRVAVKARELLVR